MKTNIIRVAFLALFGLLLVSATSKAQDSTKTHEHDKEMPSGKMDKKSGMHHGMMMHMKGMMGMQHEMTAEPDSSIIRKGEIDLKAIDENMDGKVYQCQMDFNVLSDKAGKDPKCGMKLEEVSLEKAKENLINHGYKVK